MPSAASSASTAGSASPSFIPDSRLSEWRISRGTRGLVTTDDDSTGSVGESSAPSRNASVQPRSVSALVASATSTAVSGMASTSLRAGRCQAVWSISASTSSPSRNRMTTRATTASVATKPPRGSKVRTSRPPSPSTKPATTNSAVSDTKLRRATPASRAPTISSAPNTARTSSGAVAASTIVRRAFQTRWSATPALLLRFCASDAASHRPYALARAADLRRGGPRLPDSGRRQRRAAARQDARQRLADPLAVRPARRGRRTHPARRAPARPARPTPRPRPAPQAGSYVPDHGAVGVRPDRQAQRLLGHRAPLQGPLPRPQRRRRASAGCCASRACAATPACCSTASASAAARRRTSRSRSRPRACARTG